MLGTPGYTMKLHKYLKLEADNKGIGESMLYCYKGLNNNHGSTPLNA